MVASRSPMELPLVPGWVRPPVDIPVFELDGWTGPRWVLLYQGKERLEELMLGFGQISEQDDPTSRIDVTTHAKLPRRHGGSREFARPASSFASVATGTLIMLIDRAIASLPEGKPRQSRRREVNRKLSDEGAFTIMSEELPAAFWSPLPLIVDGTPTSGFLARLPDCWAVCCDAGAVYVAVSGNGATPAPLKLSTVSDLRAYRMPGLPE